MNTISGTTQAGASVIYFGTSFGAVTADDSGDYAITVGDGVYSLASYAVNFSFDPTTAEVTVSGMDVTQNFTPTALTASSPLDSRTTPNLDRVIQDTMIFDVDGQPSKNQPIDSRAAGAPVDCRVSPPLNSRK